MDTKTKLAQGIEAAKAGNRIAAQDLLYDVVEEDPRNEAAWVWLSYVADTIPDRKICLENVLAINPANDYALRGMAQIGQLLKKETQPTAPATRRSQSGRRPLSLLMSTAFWLGLGLLFTVLGVKDIAGRTTELITSRNFPYYITPIQLWYLTIAISFLIMGIIALNVAWGLYIKSKIGYYISLLLSLGLTLLAPTALLIADSPNYLQVALVAILPVSVLFLTLMSQSGFDDDPTDTAHAQ